MRGAKRIFIIDGFSAHFSDMYCAERAARRVGLHIIGESHQSGGRVTILTMGRLDKYKG